MKTEYNKDDLKVITKQLGRKPRNLVGVAKRCQYGYPQILINYPIYNEQEEIKIFPTTYWLSCPELVKRISQLEAKGLIQEIQKEIVHDSAKFEELLSAYEKYAQNRVDLLQEKDLQKLKYNYPGRWRVISESGVGGIMEKEGIKCLHTQYADFLVNQENPVGKIVDNLLNEDFSVPYIKSCNIYCEGG